MLMAAGRQLRRVLLKLARDTELENSLSIRLHREMGFTRVSRTIEFLKKL